MRVLAILLVLTFSAACSNRVPEGYQKPRNCFQKMTRAGVGGDPVRVQLSCNARGNW